MKTRKVGAIAAKRRATAEAAMPEVKRLVKKFGRQAIANCLGKIRDYEKATAKVAALKKEAAELERKL